MKNNHPNSFSPLYLSVYKARKPKLPSSPTLHKALGELALQQGHYDDAMVEFQTARKLAPDDVGTLFKMGVVQRRSRQFEQALETFDQVAKLDGQYPGLSLERGLVYEAAGRTDEALKAYKGALAKAPDDVDLKVAHAVYLARGAGLPR